MTTFSIGHQCSLVADTVVCVCVCVCVCLQALGPSKGVCATKLKKGGKRKEWGREGTKEDHPKGKEVRGRLKGSRTERYADQSKPKISAKRSFILMR